MTGGCMTMQAGVHVRTRIPSRKNSATYLTGGACVLEIAGPFDTRTGLTERKSPTSMWPVQSLTLLLCLTDEEQLFAQRAVEPAPPAPIEWVVPAAEEVREAREVEVPEA